MRFLRFALVFVWLLGCGGGRYVTAQDAGTADPASAGTSPPQVRIENVTPDAAIAQRLVNFEVVWWTGSKPSDIRRSRDQVIAAIKRSLDSAGIEIPFPYRTLTFHDPSIAAALASKVSDNDDGNVDGKVSDDFSGSDLRSPEA